MLPHLRQFVRVRHALADARALGSTLATVLESTRFSVIQLDPRGRIVVANDLARALLRIGDGLCDRDGVLRATVPAEDDALRKLLARALSHFGRQGTSGSMVVSRALVSPRLALYVSPVSHALLDTHASRLGALVLVVDPAGRTVIDPVLVTSVLGLTPTESHLAVSLAVGTTIRGIAIETGRSEGTVRWHTKRIFTKLGISRQVELARLVLPLAEIPQNRR